MFYLLANPTTVNFQNLAQTKTINLNTNGNVVLSENLDWLISTLNTTNFRADSDTDGRRNSDVINVFETGTTAASIARSYRASDFSGITDWYLPAIDQLTSLVTSGVFTGFPFGATEYWSSTEDTSQGGTSAKSSNTSGLEQVRPKTDSVAVRPIRQISYSETTPPNSIGDDLGYGMVFSIDTLNKIIYIGSKEDLSTSQWGISLSIANANFATSITATTRVNDRYIIQRGVISLSLQEDSGVSFDVVITQDSSAEDSSKVFLKNIIDNMMVRSINERSYMYGFPRYEILLEGKRLMQEIDYNGLQEVRVFEAQISEANKIIPPIDFVNYIRLSVVNFEGRLLPLFYNNKLNISYQYVQDDTGNIIVDDLGYPIKTQGSRRNSEENPLARSYRFFDGYPGIGYGYGYDNFFRSVPGYTGGQESYTGSYRWDPDAGEFLLDNIPENFTTIVLEYVSDPILAERDETRLRIHKFFQNTMEKGIYYNIISTLRDVPANEKFRARKDFFNEWRIAKRRLNTKPHEIIQKLGADIGFSKAL